METIWINPVIKGQCTGGLSCNGGCCRVRTYSNHETYVETFCEHYNQTQGTCNIYETRPEGCRRYPEITAFMVSGIPKGCGYWIEESDKIN